MEVMMSLELAEIFKSKSYWNFLVERILSSFFWVLFIIVSLVTAILWVVSSLTDNLLCKILSILIVVFWIICCSLYKKYFIKKFKKWKIGILLAIDDKWEYEWYKMKNDLLYELNKNLDTEKFQIISVSNYWARKIQDNYKNKEKIEKYHSKIWWIYWIVWNTEKENDGWYKCFIKSNALVFHSDIPNIVQNELWMDFSALYLKDIEFDNSYYKSWIEFSATYNWIVAKYIIWVACLVSGAILDAWELHRWLEDELGNINKINKSNQKINEQYFKQISKKIKIIQYRELSYISFYYYQIWQKDMWCTWLNTWNKLSEKYWMIDAVLQNNLAIYEFLVNKNVSKSKKLLKKSGKSWNKWYRYSLVFLDLWNKNYKGARKNIKILMQKDCDDILTLNSVLKFIDEILVEYSDRFEFLYWEALIYYRHKNNIPLAFEKMESYIKNVWETRYWYEILEPNKLLSELKEIMQIE